MSSSGIKKDSEQNIREEGKDIYLHCGHGRDVVQATPRRVQMARLSLALNVVPLVRFV